MIRRALVGLHARDARGGAEAVCDGSGEQAHSPVEIQVVRTRVEQRLVNGVLHGIRSFVPRLLKAGRPAHIVNTASVGGFLPSPLMAPYSVTKFAVVALSESLYGELQMLGAPIGVSLLAPGPVDTGIFNDPFGTHIPPAVQGFVETLRGMLSQHGLSPDAFAERVFEGLAKGQFWLLPQPEAIDEQLR